MSRKLSIDPVTRIEGHLGIETRIDAGRVTEARVVGRMYRGFEQLLIGRHPVDAARITQRICGICHEVHGIAASIALEDLYGLTPPQNGLILRELILGLHLATDHIFHFYQLSLPDYIDFSRLKQYRGQDQRVAKLVQLLDHSAGTFAGGGPADAPEDTALTVEMALGYVEAIAIRREAASGLASIGGKVPFCHAILPGGFTTGVTSDRLVRYANALEKTADFIDRFYLPQALELARRFGDGFSLGRSHGNFYANGAFTLRGKPLYTGGVRLAGKRPEPLAFDRIEERVDATWLDNDGTPRPDKAGAYSWVKSMAYAGLPMEVGPLARQAVNPDERFVKLLKGFGQDGIRSSVMSRILARAFEAQSICRYLLELLPSYRLDQPTIEPLDMQRRPTGTGRGMSMAARGALNHQLSAVDGKVTAYRLLVPSTWNFGPAANGVGGTVEAALLGTPVSAAQGRDAIEIGRIVRSFDPCLACAIH